MHSSRFALLFAAFAALLSHAEAAEEQEQAHSLPGGQWEGKLTYGHPLVQNGEKPAPDSTVVIQNCGDGLQIFLGRADGTFIKDRVHKVVPHKEITFLYSLAQSASQPNGWLQSQAWTLVQVGPEALRLSYARTVVNPGEPIDSPDRMFEIFAFGMAQYKKECSVLPMAARQLV